MVKKWRWRGARIFKKIIVNNLTIRRDLFRLRLLTRLKKEKLNYIENSLTAKYYILYCAEFLTLLYLEPDPIKMLKLQKVLFLGDWG